MSTVEVLPDAAALARTAAEHVTVLALEAIAARGRFTLALAGGSTPRPTYVLLASPPFSSRIDWRRVHVFWGDERCVPPDHAESNYRAAREALLDAVPLPAAHIHRIRGEDPPAAAAAAYEETLRQIFAPNVPPGAPPVFGFDLALMGMGSDGHTASLFPGRLTAGDQRRWVVALYLEAVGMWRITLTPVILNAAANVTFLVEGAGKADRLRQVLEGPQQPERLPAQRIRPTRGSLRWLVDAAAASRLSRVE